MSLQQRHRYLLVAAALVVSTFALRAVVFGLVVGDPPGWLPTFESPTETVAAYSRTLQFYGELFVPAAAFWLGIRYARADDRDTARER